MTTWDEEIATYAADRMRIAPVPPASIQAPIDGVLGVNVFIGAVRSSSDDEALSGSVPDLCVFVTPTSGFSAVFYLGTAEEESERGGWDRPTFQLTARGDPKDPDSAAVLADAVFRAVDRASFGQFDDVRAVGPPAWIREDEDDRTIYAFNVETRRCRT